MEDPSDSAVGRRLALDLSEAGNELGTDLGTEFGTGGSSEKSAARSGQNEPSDAATSTDLSRQWQLLRALRDLLAQNLATKLSLSRAVGLIARSMGADVCSIYVARPGEVMELIATRGLNEQAVGRTRLRLDQGLVGTIARSAQSLALNDAQSHPNFAFCPETGEEAFSSFLGVPILRQASDNRSRRNRVVGVLVVQHIATRAYSDDDMESLGTIALLLRDMLASQAEVFDASGSRALDSASQSSERLSGLAVVPGQVRGIVAKLDRALSFSKVLADDASVERTRLSGALATLESSLDGLSDLATQAGAGIISRSSDGLAVLEGLAAVVRDRGWRRRIDQGIETGLTAEAASWQVLQEYERRFSQIEDPHLRDRFNDIRDLSKRLISLLTQEQQAGHGGEAVLPPPANTAKTQGPRILVAQSLSPAQLLELDRASIGALVLEEGTAQSHVVVIAQALQIPTVVGVKGLCEICSDGEAILVDAHAGRVLLRPRRELVELFDGYLDDQAREDRNQRTHTPNRIDGQGNHQLPPLVSSAPRETKDGVRVKLLANAGLILDLPLVRQSGAEGVGLYRTELPFLVHHRYPTVREQTQLYRQAIEALPDLPITFRTFDIGGDKVLRGDVQQHRASEENPAMGWRALRIALDVPSLLRDQVDALAAALTEAEGATDQTLRVMLPMVSSVDDAARGREIIERTLARRQAAGLPVPARVEVGAMLEIPSLIWQLEPLAQHVDFLSVGSNDLIQFLTATDRSNARFTNREANLTPAVLSMLRQVAQTCDALDLKAAVCGEMAGSPLDALALLACGFRSLSMAPRRIPAIAQMTRTANLSQAEDLLLSLLARNQVRIRSKLAGFARDTGVEVGPG